MNKTLGVLLAALLVLGPGLIQGRVVAENDVINVPGDYPTIQQAIDAASEGDTVMVAAWLYKENIVIDKSLTLKGAKAGVDARDRTGPETIIEGDDDQIAISILTTGGRVVVIDGLTVQNALHAISTPEAGVMAAHIIVRNLRVLNIGEFGISPTFTEEVTVEYCYVEDVRIGINSGAVTPYPATVATLRNNELVNVRYGFTGYLKDSLIEGNLVRCTVTDKSITVGTGISGQFFDTQVKNNIVSGYTDGAGMSFAWHYGRGISQNVKVEGNTFTENRRGIHVFASQTELKGIAVNFNNIFDNTGHGVYNDGGEVLDARWNWWGHPDGPGGLGPGDRDRVSARVVYSPWLGAESGAVPMSWGVDPTGLIQDALDAASSGDTIIVAEGEYREDLGIEKSLTIRSVGGAEATTVIGSVSMDLTGETAFLGGDGAGFTINADGRDFALRLCLEGGSQVTIRENILIGAAAGVATCLDGLGDNSAVTISYNKIRQNNEHGIYLASIGAGSNVFINSNDITENGNDGLYVEDSIVTVDATNNWWGDASGPYHSVANPGGTGNAVSDDVSFEPWLGAPLRTLEISSDARGAVTTPGERAFVYAPGTEVALEATPNAGYGFDRWTGDVGTIADVRAPVTTIVMNGDYSITARFKSLQCFLASAAYGTDAAEGIEILREFRDTVLVTNSQGARFVALYYRISPPVADYISRYEVLRMVVRMGFIGPMVVVLASSQGLWSAGR